MLPYFFNSEKLPSYGIMMFLGIGVCFVVLIFADKNRRVKRDDKIYGGALALVGGLFGAKLLSVLTSINLIISSDLSFIDLIKSGFVFYGGLLGGLAGITIYSLVYKVKLLDFYDCGALVLPIGQAFGRVGCFLAGCCFGRPTDSFLGVTYHISADPNTPLGVKILPTQLFETAYCLLIFGVLFFLSRKRMRSGVITAAYMILYSICRFINEFFRADAARGFLLGMSTSQFISIFIFLGGLFILWFVYLRKPKGAIKAEDEQNAEQSDKKDSAEKAEVN